MKYCKGITWINDCRIPFVADDKFDIRRYNRYHDTFSSYEDRGSAEGKYEVNEPNSQGRFPANILVCDDMLNDGSVSSIKQNKDYIPPNEANSIHNYTRGKYSGIQDKGTNSRYYDIDKWFNNLIDG